ncbi:universal stress protein [Hydrogenophaga sp. BPS33]|uniref:universal stress protein n=1 Tax=Hydrogenophaga sp. BPS33 TaxID=2651974 RepID=UPI00131F8FB0|nr:universal stress protein [Hydrogenophaga sp. BPS33]QHE86136.1 universal stress protein [Hydrogenophaga sp. BPS33]
MSYKRILVPYDGSETSDKALVAALNMAREQGGRVRVIHDIDELAMASGYEYAGELAQLARDQGKKLLDDALVMVRAAGVEGDTRLLDVPGRRLGDAVSDEAAVWQADLVVVGTHGRRGLSRVLLGSGAESVIRLSTVPVLVIRGDDKGVGS